MAAQEPSSIYSSRTLDVAALRASLGDEAARQLLRGHRMAILKSILVVLALVGSVALLFWLI